MSGKRRARGLDRTLDSLVANGAATVRGWVLLAFVGGRVIR